MIFCYKVLNGLTPKSLFDIIRYRMTYIPIQEHSKSEQIYTQFYSRTKSFGSTFFPFCIKEWNKLDTKIRNLSSVSKFKKSLLICSKTDENSIFDVHNPTGIQLLLNFVPLNEHKFCYNFQDTVHYAFVMRKLKLPVTISCVAFAF